MFMKFSRLLTDKNVEILELLMTKKMHLREIAKTLHMSPAKVHGCIRLFSEYGLVKEMREKNRKIISLDKNSDAYKKIEVLFAEGEGRNDIINLFDTVSPLDFRYYGRSKLFEELQPYLSEEAFIKYMARVEAALTRALAKLGMCSMEIAAEVEEACKKVTADEVYREEDRIKHNVRALANSIRNKVSDKAKPYVHFTTTSHDIICTADALRYKEFTNDVLLNELVKLEDILIELALREKKTVQIGRTHGQHAEPITFGFAIAQYVDRLGNAILRIKRAASDLRGKIAGAVGAYNASELFFKDPEKFEALVLKQLNLKPSPISTQVVEPEYMLEYVHAVTAALGILANLSDDMRHLQRSEIAEVGEAFGAKQVGSSTMPQKRNPINFENVKAMWKAFMPRIATAYMDQISEHQRDLTNSATSRFVPETLVALMASSARLRRVMGNLVVDRASMQKNFDMNKGLIVAEPLYILLAAYGHSDAHEYVRELTLLSQKTGKPVQQLIKKDKALRPYLKKFNKTQLEIIARPERYIGIAVRKVESLARKWKGELRIR